MGGDGFALSGEWVLFFMRVACALLGLLHYHCIVVLFFNFHAYSWRCFSPFMGEYLFFEWPKKRYQKKGHPAVLAFGVSVRFSIERALWNSLRSDSPRAIPR